MLRPDGAALSRAILATVSMAIFEVLIDECSQSLVSYWHPNQDVNLPWLRFVPLIFEPPPTQVTGAQKIVQLTGEFDREGWDGNATAPLAYNQTESRYGIRG